jgi:proline iminopeptidase
VFADIRDTRIFFDVDGMSVAPEPGGIVERKTAFFVHGGPGLDHVGMKGGSKELAARMQLVFFDMRGHGRSSPCSPEAFTLDENVEDMEALRRYLGLGPIVSLGASYGGMVAMAHAARYPDAVSHLILVTTASHKGLLDRAVEVVAERGTSAQVAMMDRMLSGSMSTQDDMIEYFKVMAPLYGRNIDEAAFAKSLGRARWSPEIGCKAFGPGGHTQTFDLRPELGNIKAPTLILAGRHDFICAPEFSVEMNALIGGSTLKIFENSSHFLTADEPQNYIDAVAGFLVHNEARPCGRGVP